MHCEADSGRRLSADLGFVESLLDEVVGFCRIYGGGIVF